MLVWVCFCFKDMEFDNCHWRMAAMGTMQETENYVIFLCQLISKLIIYIKRRTVKKIL